MFDLRKPCVNCPFRKSQGPLFRLPAERITDIFEATAFECHKTTGVVGPKREPQQCAGLIALLHKEQSSNAIMRAAMILTGYDPGTVDGSEVYDSFTECLAGHAQPERKDHEDV